MTSKHPSLLSAIKKDHVWALRLAVKALEDTDLIEAPHHAVLCKALDDVFEGRTTRLLINISPGFSKTLTAVWATVARGIISNPKSRYLHTSYSSDLALDNSAKIKQLIGSPAFRLACEVDVRDDTSAKGLWRTKEGGGMRAAAAGSGITGFRAGNMTEGFSGIAIADDPVKPSLESSRKQMADVNLWYNNTFASRLAHEGVPIVVIMQRIAAYSGTFEGEDLAKCGDLSEYLLRGGSGETWSHLMLPAEIDNSLPYPKEWTHGEPIEHGLPDGPLWPYKISEADIARLKRANKYVYAAQYAQRPKKRTGDPLIDRSWFGRYTETPKEFRRMEVFADTANKTKEANDYSVFLVAGQTENDDIYILDVKRGKWTIPKLLPQAEDFWNKWRDKGATRFRIEDAQSGTYLIQALEEKIHNSVTPISRDKDKFTRINGVTEPISSGRVFVPASAPWVEDFLQECEDFTDDDSHDNDDQCDTLADAIETLIMNKHTPAEHRPVAGFW